jgi:carbon dioxide concentrating mechanism protein CcmM
MVAQEAAPAMPRLSLTANPQIHPAAIVHEFSLLRGHVQLGAGAMVAPGAALTAEPGATVAIGENVSLLPGVAVDGVSGAQVMGAEGPCSVWVGDRTTLAHKALIHGPAYIGKDCFIGFRSTIFNARIGDGCVIMMHALVQDVELLPGKCVPSGSLITTQHQADQLPSVRPDDLEFAKEIMGAAAGSSSGSSFGSSSRARLVPIDHRSGSPHQSAQNLAAQAGAESRSHGTSYISPTPPEQSSYSHRQSPPSHSSPSPNHPSYATGAAMQTQRLAPEIVQQVRQYLSSGYRIGMEHADARRYRSGVWETCTPIKDTHEQAVFSALERCLSEHAGEYVRMFGIDPQRKQRVGMVTVQRPDGRPVTLDAKSMPASNGHSNGYSNGHSSASSYGASSNGSGGLSPSVVQEIRNLLRGGYVIGTEHADARRYRSNVWKVCSPIKSDREQEVFARLEHCLDEHSGEYVRMFGIDPRANRRTANITIQRADGKPVQASSSRIVSSAQPSSGGSESYSTSSGIMGGDTLQAVSQILRQGNQVGIEYADARRYRSGIWQTAPTLQSRNDSGAMSQLQGFLNENTDKYVRIFGINQALKTRTAATTIQKPGQKLDPQNSQSSSGSSRDPINSNSPHYDDSASRRGGAADASVMNQVTQLINQGCQIALEFADKRRFRSGIWQTGPAINARRPAEAIDALNQQLAQNPDSYVRLVGIDPKAKRRVLEFTIQKPGQAPSPQASGSSHDPINANPPHYDDPSYLRSGAGQRSAPPSRGNNGALDSSVMDQVTQLVNQGCQIAVEFADKRRFRSGIWQTGAAIDARRPAEAISALGKQLAQHSGDYVRLVGIDPKAKRRVLETTIQRP